MLALESYGTNLSAPLRILIDCSLLDSCVFSALYFMVFKEMDEQIRFRRDAEQAQSYWFEKLELLIDERTDRLQKANEELLIEVQQRAKSAMALRAAFFVSQSGQ